MIEGPIKETVTDSEKIYEYTTVCTSGTRANVKVIRPILSDEEYDRRKREVEQELIRFAQGVIADGHDWKELVQSNAQKMEDA
ncbi:MAG: hypothetical protein NC485_14890 [Ruminococcus flavefaciens]|nr:hypothetical protein [Ruminococcus flavefaciens]